MLFAFYRQNSFKTVWSKAELRKAAATAVSGADADGLDPKDYNLNQLQKFEKKINSLSEREMVEYDILLTLSLRKYLDHLLTGKLNPKELYRNWDLRPQADVNTVLSVAIAKDSLVETIEESIPSDLTYRSLRLALQIVSDFPKDRCKEIFTDDVKITYKDTNNSILDIKTRLVYWKDLERPDSMTNVYDKRMLTAVKKFQARHGLAADGVIGKGTVAAMNFSRDDRKAQIIANLERWRWFPRDLGDHYFIINIPGYILHVVKDGDTIESKRVVVGKLERMTPVLSSKFSEIIVNPTWTIPPTIIREDLTPAATLDRNYFQYMAITIYNWKNEIISPEQWKPEKAKSYRYVQSPGDFNALGNVKFNFPSRYLVYLHDTNHKDYFVKNKRSLSSGCVRVEDPLPLAEYMLNDDKNWNLEKIYEVISTKETTRIKLKEKIGIHQWYWTAWSENNELIFRDDVYNLDVALYNKLRN
jgi:murein L,D-transpeptidase YcbB/YkuD